MTIKKSKTPKKKSYKQLSERQARIAHGKASKKETKESRKGN